MGSFHTRGKAPLLHTEPTGLFRPTSALPTPSVGVPASPWVWAKARSKLGALIRLCGDGAVSNEARIMGSLTREKAPLLHTDSTGLFRPTTTLSLISNGSRTRIAVAIQHFCDSRIKHFRWNSTCRLTHQTNKALSNHRSRDYY
jgi:hypothetical protein